MAATTFIDPRIGAGAGAAFGLMGLTQAESFTEAASDIAAAGCLATLALGAGIVGASNPAVGVALTAVATLAGAALGYHLGSETADIRPPVIKTSADALDLLRDHREWLAPGAPTDLKPGWVVTDDVRSYGGGRGGFSSPSSW